MNVMIHNSVFRVITKVYRNVPLFVSALQSVTDPDNTTTYCVWATETEATFELKLLQMSGLCDSVYLIYVDSTCLLLSASKSFTFACPI
jgi:hypothetical protein